MYFCKMNVWIDTVSDALWGWCLIFVLIGCALWFTLRSRGVQFRMIGEMFRLLGESTQKKDGQHRVSSFQAFAVSIASRVGTGNLAGVATAMAVGGPGAIFWMWLLALLGAATAFVESTLAQLFKQPDKDSFVGGPAYYIRKGLHQPVLAVVFAVLLILTFGLSYNSIQSNTICSAMQEAFGIDPHWGGWILCFLSLGVVFGGIKRIAKVSSLLVPFMALGYIGVALFIIFRHWEMIPNVLGLIFENAFGFRQAAGGFFGATVMTGIKRGLFSNEAGEGSTPNVAATASTSHPIKQGLIQALGVFTDTLVVCSCTAFIILFSGTLGTGQNGIALTQAALQHEIGHAGVYFVAIAILMFAYTSIIGNYYYGEANLRYLLGDKPGRGYLIVFRVLSGGLFVLFGGYASLETVWSVGDLFMALITAVNLFAIVRLSPLVWRLLDQYRAQRKAGQDPVFHRSDLPGLELEAWQDEE